MDKNNYWLSVIFPIAAISSGFSVLIPIYILSLNGNVIDVSIATTVYAFAVIPASLLWGELTQRLKRIKIFIVISIIGIFPIVILLYLIRSILLADIMYAAYAMVLTASSPAINMLVLDRRKKVVLRSYFGVYSLLTIIGNIIGYIPGILLDSDIVARYLLIIIAFNTAGLIFTMLFVRERKPKIERERKRVNEFFPLFNVISKFPQVLTGHHLILRLSSIRKRTDVKRIFVLFLAIAIMNFGIYFFNTSYIPFLYSYHVTFSMIFLVSMANAVGQVFVYVAFMRGRTKRTLRSYYRIAMLVRSGGYVVAIVSIMALSFLLFMNLVSYFIAGIGYALWNISASVIIYSNIAGRKEAHYIGIWSAILGASGVLGALFSGFTSFYAGYMYTFAISIFFTLLSLLVFRGAYSNADIIKDYGNRI